MQDKIAITGMSGSFAASKNIHNYRDNLFNKIDMVSGDYGSKWQRHPDIPDKIGQIPNLDDFDLGFYGVTTSQGDGMSPMLRIALEKTFEAIVDAGYHPSDLEGSNTGVFVGSSFSETQHTVFFNDLKTNADAIIGTQRSMLAKRISYSFKLRGPSYQMDAACSGSLHALTHAFIAIKEGKCDRAIVCGCHLSLLPTLTIVSMLLGILSKDGKSKCFDEEANGFGRSEAVVTLLLEKNAVAKRIYAEIIHAKTNCDGYKSESITFPSAQGQKMLLQDFYDECKIDPKTLTYMEAHSTGTKIGDPQETNILDAIICTNRNEPLYIGSVRSNVGHAEPASGLCSIVKIILAMETGYIPPNIHFSTPRKDIGAFEAGRMIVATEKIGLPDDRGLFGVNSFGFGGTNAHALLHWNPKTKFDNPKESDLPGLICVSGRIKEGVDSIFDDFFRNNCDEEQAYLLREIFRYSQTKLGSKGGAKDELLFRKPIQGHLYRGYTVYNRGKEIRRSWRKLDRVQKKLYLVFGPFNKNWIDFINMNLKIPIFLETIRCIQEILLEKSGFKLDEIMTNPRDLSMMEQNFLNVITQIGLANIFKDISLMANGIIGVGSGELAASYMKNRLSLRGVISELCENYRYDKEIIGKDSYKKLEDCIYLICGFESSDFTENSINLVSTNSEDCTTDFLISLGKLYQNGFNMELNKLYPEIKLPVNRGTPMLSPLIEWNHDKNCAVYNEVKSGKSEEKVVEISPTLPDWSYVTGHVADGRNLFPAIGYLFLVWQHFAEILDKSINEMAVVFEDVRLIRGTNIPEDGAVKFTTSLQLAGDAFEIIDHESVVITGRIHEQNDEDLLIDIAPTYDTQDLCMDQDDIYRELRLKGYQYSGGFKSIKKCNIEVTQAIIEWNGNWVTFIDGMLQLSLLWTDSRDLHLPIVIERVAVNAPEHLKLCEYGNQISVEMIKESGLIRGCGVEVRGIKTTAVSRRSPIAPLLETIQFLPNITSSFDKTNSIRSFVQIALENANLTKANIVEVCSGHQKQEELLYPIIQSSLDDSPFVEPDITILSEKNLDSIRVPVQNKPISSKTNCLILVVSNFLETIKVDEALNAISGVNGFIISRERLDTDLSKFSKTPFNIISFHTNIEEKLVLLRSTPKTISPHYYLDVTNSGVNLEWIRKLQNLLKNEGKVVLYTQNDAQTGVIGLLTTLRKEFDAQKVTCFLILDDAPKFDPRLKFYKDQLQKDMLVNIWKEGSWGTCRFLPMLENQSLRTENCYVDIGSKGDLSSLRWMEETPNEDDLGSSELNTVHIYYSSLNFRDIMIASGKLSLNVTDINRCHLQSNFGVEFSGRDSNGQAVMGLVPKGSLATRVQTKAILPIPEGWTMEDAATIMMSYSTIATTLFKDLRVSPNQSILIHSACGGIGLAAINLSLHFGLTIFVTVGGSRKREFIREFYPQIGDENIGYSRDISFEEMILKRTGGKGVDYVLNSLSEDKLIGSIRCLAKGGRFIELGKSDLSNHNALDLNLLEKEAEFVSISFDRNVLNSEASIRVWKNIMLNLITCGAIKPLPRTIFGPDDLENAFRYLSGGEHIGKILIKIRSGDGDMPLIPRRLFKAKSRFYCKPDCSYLICGGLGGFGMELADFLVTRGARKIVLNSRSGLTNGYQRYRIRIWENYGVKIVVSTQDASIEGNCIELLTIVKSLGTVDGIFNVALALKDGVFLTQNRESFKIPLTKADCTRNLDRISKIMCADLRYFVMFSSYTAGRGISGQTNYGMANAIIDRICEKRKKDGYPALAIQWGSIREVGFVGRLQDYKGLSIEGTSPQTVISCLQTLEKFLLQNHPVVASTIIAEKSCSTKADSLLETVLNIIGIRNIKTVSTESSFAELGVDSIMVVDIKQVLEKEYDVFLNIKDIMEMTLTKLDLVATPGKCGNM